MGLSRDGEREAMRRFTTTRVLVTLVSLLAVLAGGIGSIAAQDTGTGATQLPEGVAVTVLGRQEIDPMPAAPAYIGLARLTYQPGAGVPVQRADGPTVIYVDSGTVTVQTGEAAAQATPTAGGSTLSAGQQILIPAGTSFATRNDGAIPAVALRLAIYPSAPDAVAEQGIRFERLAGAVAQTLPSGRAFVTLSRVTLTPGSNTVTRTRQEDGPDLAYVDTGTLGVTAPGIDTTLSPGNMAFVEAGVAASARNAGFGPTVALVISISTEPGDTGVTTPQAETPTS